MNLRIPYMVNTSLKKKIPSHLQKYLFFYLITLVIFTSSVIFCVIWNSVPGYQQITQMAMGSDRILLDESGQELQILRTDFSKRRLHWHLLPHFSNILQRTVIESEDRRFYFHHGIDFSALFRSLVQLIKGNHIQGGSTLTMQLSDLIQRKVLTKNQSIHKGTVWHKIQQLIRAPIIEIKWSKKQILEAYLNLIHLRGEYQGIPAASYAYFNKHPFALDQNESALLSALISAPNQSMASLMFRSCHLINRSLISENSNELNCEDPSIPLNQLAKKINTKPSLSFPLFNHALHLSKRLFPQYPNKTIVPTYINLSLQKTVASLLEKNIHALYQNNVNDSAAIVIENSTGKVLAYVGAVSSSLSFQIDGIQAPRQAGSTLKPFIYGRTIDQKYITSASILNDDQSPLSWGGEVYRPLNYNKQFFGEVTVREALGSSLNVPAIKVAIILGLRNTYDLIQSLHFSTLKEPDFYGISMALGAVDVRLDELTNAYRVFAQGGQWSPLKWSPLETKTSSSQREKIFSPGTSFIISHILSDPNARVIGFGWGSPLESSFWTAVKTGTSKDYRDNWCIGFSEKYTVGVWAGNFNAQGMNKVSGVTGAAPSWLEIMEYLHKNTPSKNPPVPSDVRMVSIRHLWRNQFFQEYFLKGTEIESGSVIETTKDQQAQFVFPAEGSVLIKDPKIDPSRIALNVSFKGHIPPQSDLFLNGQRLGPALNPYKISNPPTGIHQLSIVSPQNRVVTQVHFSIKGE